MKSRCGFTLIELIVVIAILAVLVTIAAPRLSSYIESANQSSDRQKAAIVCNAAAIYYAVNPEMIIPANSDSWFNILITQKLILPADLQLASNGYTNIEIYGPNNGVVKVVLSGDFIEDYVYTISK